jgi:hypothetical protein
MRSRHGSAPGPEGRNLDHFCHRIAAVAAEDLTSYLQSRVVNVPGFSKRYGAQGYGNLIHIEDREGNTLELNLANLPYP